MAADNLSYRELVDHDELMNALREVLSNVKELYELYSPQVLDDHNTSSVAHTDIRQSLQELSAVLESYRSSLSARIDSNAANITAINNEITEIKATNPTSSTVNNGALIIQKNGTTVNTFTKFGLTLGSTLPTYWSIIEFTTCVWP